MVIDGCRENSLPLKKGELERDFVFCPIPCLVSNVILRSTFTAFSINSATKNLRVGLGITRIKPHRSETLRYAQGDITITFNTKPQFPNKGIACGESRCNQDIPSNKPLQAVKSQDLTIKWLESKQGVR
jgi:hypothetical protein